MVNFPDFLDLDFWNVNLNRGSVNLHFNRRMSCAKDCKFDGVAQCNQIAFLVVWLPPAFNSGCTVTILDARNGQCVADFNVCVWWGSEHCVVGWVLYALHDV